MKTIEIQLYKFEELSEEAQQATIEKLYDINVSHDWYQFTYEDAENIGLKIDSFDLYGRGYVNLNVLTSHTEIAEAIIKLHGEGCDTYETASEFLKDRDNLVYQYSDKLNTEVVAEGNECDFDNDCDELEAQFIKDLSEIYRLMLTREYEYLTSEETIRQTIIANEYDFLIDGGDIY